MLGIIGVAAATSSGVIGHLKSKDFVARRMRFTSWVENPLLGVIVGAGAALVAAPVVAVIPFVGAGTALAFGLGVGTGVAVGQGRARSGGVRDDV